jgi:ADP-L-glycero-D-manno-heptose 6-epimerase
LKIVKESILPLDELLVILEDLRKNKKKIVLTNGCYDLLHVGHIECLKYAKSLGDVLVVAINDDTSIKQIKGSTRPIVTLKMRAEVINSIKVVDYVISFSEKTATEVVKKIKPDFYVKDADYDIKNTPEGIEVIKQGGKVCAAPRIKDISTTSIINKIYSTQKELGSDRNMILVTGGCGLIGSNIIEALNNQGINDIIVTDELDHSNKWQNICNKNIADLVEKDKLFDIISKYDFNTVIHMGACTDTTEKDSRKMMEDNFYYSKKLWEYCSEKKLKFIYASSASVYGDGSLGFSENIKMDDLTPLNVYAYSKLLFDRWNSKQKATPPNWVGLRFFNVYGSGEFHKGKMASMMYQAYLQIRKEKKVCLFKDCNDGALNGEQKRDFVYVKDVADVIMHFFNNSNYPSGIYNLGTGTANTFNELVKDVFNAMNQPIDIEYIDMPTHIQAKYQSYTRADMRKLREEGYTREFTSLKDGITDYISCLESLKV